ncbi:MAG: SUF system NifU family Fe-S cluster assembly protein [Candidatus Electryonea clarkiae]|nr:SUF system NifU family Fe-S cluster assembly protein [Candidatus Electryonea clarkiae]MDP8285307.1 SUF system NifU family Fe-S cluster assembly protein [Candidatus Electryonea clarkiae]
MNDQLNELYRDIIMDHYRDPRGRKKIDDADAHSEGKNPTCGDEVEMDVRIKDDIVEEIGVHCAGCAISVASGSMLSEVVEGKSIEEVKTIAAAVKAKLTGGESSIDLDDFGDLDVLKGVQQFPVRIKCALLSWVTLMNSIESWEHGHSHPDVSTE